MNSDEKDDVVRPERLDRWGLFNPPGIGPLDKDPDDDIPFRGFEEDPEE